MASTDVAAAGGDKKKKGGAGTIIALILLTLIGCGTGGGLGIYLTSTVEKIVAERAKAEADKPKPELKYGGDTRLLKLEPIITNLATPKDTWIRLETSIVFANGTIDNPDVVAGQIRDDLLSFLRTVPLSQLDGPSALLHLRDDLTERAVLRTNGAVKELIIEALLIQ